MSIPRLLPLLLLLILAASLLSGFHVGRVEAQPLTEAFVGVWSPTYGTWNITNPGIGVGATFELDVNITGVSGLASYDVSFIFNPQVVGMTDPCDNAGSDPCNEANELKLGDVFAGNETNGPVTVYIMQASNNLGKVRVVVDAGSTSFSGNGVLFKVPFTVFGVGSTKFLLSSILVNVNLDSIDHTDDQDGGFNNSGKIPPVAQFRFTWVDSIISDGKITVGELVMFNATQSFDPDAAPGSPNKGIISYLWQWGDSSSANRVGQPLINHTFTNAGRIASGNFTVTLTVEDSDLKTGALSQVVTVHPTPSHGVKVQMELSLNTVQPGQVLTITVTVTNLSTDFAENVNFTVVYGSTVVWSQPSFALTPLGGSEPTRKFDQNWVADLGPGGYEIAVIVPPVAGETILSDNIARSHLDVVGEQSSSLPLIGGLIFTLILAGAVLYFLKGRRARAREAEEDKLVD